MVNGNEYVFDNIDLALEYVMGCEKNALTKDPCRQQPPIIIPASAIPLSKPITQETIRNLKPLAMDSLSYPLSAWFNNADDDKFVMTRLQSGRYSLKPNLKNRKYLFRGESEFHNPCKPNISRNPTQHRYTAEFIWGQEMRLLMMSHPLVQLLDLGVELDGQLIRFEMNLFGLTQHYYNKTPFLDLTSDPLVAAFFATTKYHWESDTYTPITDDKHEPGVFYYYSLDINEDFGKPTGILITPLATIGLQVFPRSGRQKGFLYSMQPKGNFNDVVRVNAVRFRHDGEIACRICEQFNNGETLFPDDILMQHWRSSYLDSKVISKYTVLMNKIDNPSMTYSQVEAEVKSLGFEIQNYRPTFTQNELDVYYDSIIKNGFWVDFCRQIHIPGDGQGQMMRDLLDLPNNPKYRWAFERDENHITNYDKGFVLRMYKACLV